MDEAEVVPRQLTDADDMIGRTVERVYHETHGDEFFVIFDDGTYVVFRLWHAGPETSWVALATSVAYDAKVNAGVANEDDHREERKYREYLAGLAARRERTQYEQLKAKFEGGAS